MALQRRLRRVFAIALVLGMATAAAATGPAATAPSGGAPPVSGDLFDQIYKQAAPFEKTLTTVSASFVETTTSTLLKSPLVARGTLVGRRPRQVRLVYSGADSRTVIVDGNSLTLEWPGRHLADTRDISGMMRRADRFFVASTAA